MRINRNPQIMREGVFEALLRRPRFMEAVEHANVPRKQERFSEEPKESCDDGV